MWIFTDNLYKVDPKAMIHNFDSSTGCNASHLMDVPESEYDLDPLYIRPNGFLVYDPDSDRTELVMGNTNMLQKFAVWQTFDNEVFYVNVNQLVPIG